MYCTKCGAEAPSAARYCGQCGQTLKATQDQGDDESFEELLDKAVSGHQCNSLDVLLGEMALGNTVSLTIGKVRRRRLSISPEEISWDGVAISVDRTAAIRWGMLQETILVGFSQVRPEPHCDIWIKDDRRSISIHCKRGRPEGVADNESSWFGRVRIYEAVRDIVWCVAGARLLAKVIHQLSAGETITLCGIDVSSDGVVLKHPFLAGLGYSKKLVRWEDGISSGVFNGKIGVGSLSAHTSINIRKADNAPVLNALVNLIGHDENYAILRNGGMARIDALELNALGVRPSF